MACAECEKTSTSEIDMVRDIERMRAVIDQLANQQAVSGWKGEYAYNHMHSHMSTIELVSIMAMLGLAAWCVWVLLFPSRDDAE